MSSSRVVHCRQLNRDLHGHTDFVDVREAHRETDVRENIAKKERSQPPAGARVYRASLKKWQRQIL